MLPLQCHDSSEPVYMETMYTSCFCSSLENLYKNTSVGTTIHLHGHQRQKIVKECLLSYSMGKNKQAEAKT